MKYGYYDEINQINVYLKEKVVQQKKVGLLYLILRVTLSSDRLIDIGAAHLA